MGRENWGLVLLAAVSLAVGALFQDPVLYGWVAAAAGGLLMVRMAVRFEAEPGTIPDYSGPGGRKAALLDGLLALLHLGLLGGITYLIADAIELTRGAASLGNEALLIAAAWGVYGLLLVLIAPLAPRAFLWVGLGQAFFLLGLGFLLMGGMLAQGRWADPGPRFAAYAGVPGAMLLSAWVQHRRGSLREADRLIALAAVLFGFGICSFEVKRWLEPALTHSAGTVTTAMLAWGRNLVNGVSLGLWGLYAALVRLAGRRLDSRPLYFLGAALGGSVAVYLLVWLGFMLVG